MRFVTNSRHPVELVWRVLGIACPIYYRWCTRLDEPSAWQIADEALPAEIVDIHTSSGGTYGSPRVHAMLVRRGISVGRKRVERVMRGAGRAGPRRAAARARGQRLGRPPAMTEEQVRQTRALLTRPDESVSSIARLLGISRTTLYKYLPELTAK
ncbi:IS3 family transposase [Nocardia sp. NPDC050193]